MIVAVTGELASGKSKLRQIFAAKGCKVFDCDQTIHGYYCQAKHPVTIKVKRLFPQAIVAGRICRNTLGRIVFSDEKQRLKLEAIVHPAVIADLKKWIKQVGRVNPLALAEVPLLFEKNLAKYFDLTILVYCKRNILIKRINDKLGLKPFYAQQRLALFKPLKEKMNQADIVIDNNRSEKLFKRSVELLWEMLKEVRR